MAEFWEQWFTNPAQNNMAPPYGAGEKKMQFDQITDTFRVVMAACAQIGNRVASAVGTLGKQNKDAVDITGGSITGTTLGTTCKIDAVALTSGLLALARLPTNLSGKLADGLTSQATQQLYNLLWPVGTIRLWHTNNFGTTDGLVWSGVTATWVVVANSGDRFIVSSGIQTNVQSGAGTMLPQGNFTSGNAAGTSPIPTGLNGSGIDHNHAVPYNMLRYGFNIVRRSA